MRKYFKHHRTKIHMLLRGQSTQFSQNHMTDESSMTNNENDPSIKLETSTNTDENNLTQQKANQINTISQGTNPRKPVNGRITNTTKPPCKRRLKNNSTQESTQKSTQQLTQDTNQKSTQDTDQKSIQEKNIYLTEESTQEFLEYCEEIQPPSNFPWGPIIAVLAVIGLIAFIIWLIWSIRKRIETTKKYNQTPEHFIENPQLSLNQAKNFKLNKIQTFKKYTQKDCLVEQKVEYGGSLYEVSFKNLKNSKFSAVYWSKKLKTDSYFEVQIDTLDSQIEFGFVGVEYFGQLNDGIETKLSRVGVSINSEGHLQVHGETKYQYRWNLQYGDVVGMGLTKIQGNKRVWITKNGILLNPPTQDQVEKWLTKQQLSNSHRDAYHNFNLSKSKNFNKKQDIDLMKRKILLPNSQEFNYYAVLGSWEVTGNQMGKSKNLNKEVDEIGEKACTKVRINVGGKSLRLKDHNLRSGLLADPIQKNQICNWLPCF